MDGEERKKERKKRKVKVKNFSLFRKEKEKLEKKFFKTFQSCAITNFRKILFIIQN